MKFIVSAILVVALSLANGSAIPNVNTVEQDLVENELPPMLSAEAIMKLVNGLEYLKNDTDMFRYEERDLHPDIAFDSKAKTVSFNGLSSLIGVHTVSSCLILAGIN